MDLGFSELTDDQLLEMWKQLYAEFSTRLFSTTELAHQVVITEAEKIEAHRKGLKFARVMAKQNYVNSIMDEIRQLVYEEIQNGSIRIITPEEEAQAIFDADQGARKQALGEAKAAMRAYKAGEQFQLSVRRDRVFLNMGTRKFEVLMSPTSLAQLKAAICSVI